MILFLKIREKGEKGISIEKRIQKSEDRIQKTEDRIQNLNCLSQINSLNPLNQKLTVKI